MNPNTPENQQRPGAILLREGGCLFRVWAPEAEAVSLRLDQDYPMEKTSNGYWLRVQDVPAGTRYQFVLDSETVRPDPASLSQPDGVHEASEVVDLSRYDWNDQGWRGVPLREMVQYELHIGTFTEEGTFDSAVKRLDDLVDLGVNTVELMPVCAFPGKRNWGYDGVYPYAVHETYGGAPAFMRFVDECHQRGLAVCLDVVYNHLGPEGNYLWSYGPYFTDRYQTPWGSAVNFDGEHSDEVRRFFIDNALMWMRDFHVDALRLDATHAIFDVNAKTFLQQLAEEVEALGSFERRSRILIAESDLNDPRLIRPRQLGGFGLDGQWCDDFHHAVHTLITGERDGYYCDFGRVEDLAHSFRHGYVYTGQYASHRGRSQGAYPEGCDYSQFVVCIQNHDQVGNRMTGDRFSTGGFDLEQLKLAAAVLLTSPMVPMLFMGEEYGEPNPFQYFVDHGDEHLIEAVRNGRAEEFEAFQWKGEVPDPASEEAFVRSKLSWIDGLDEDRKALRSFYRELIRARKFMIDKLPDDFSATKADALEDKQCLVVSREFGRAKMVTLFNFGSEAEEIDSSLHGGEGSRLIDSADPRWNGPGSHTDSLEDKLLKLQPKSAVVYLRD